MSPIPDAKVSEVRQNLMRRTGHDVQLSVDVVASKRELTDLMERLSRTAPVEVAKAKTVEELQRELLSTVEPAVQEIWPSSDAPIENIQVILGSDGIAVSVFYQAAKDLGEIPANMVRQSLQKKLGMANLTLKTARSRPTRPSENRKRP